MYLFRKSLLLIFTLSLFNSLHPMMEFKSIPSLDIFEGILPQGLTENPRHENDSYQRCDTSMVQTLAVLIDRTYGGEQSTNTPSVESQSTEQSTSDTISSIEFQSTEQSTSYAKSQEYQSAHEFYSEMARDNALDMGKDIAPEQDHQPLGKSQPRTEFVTPKEQCQILDAIELLESKLESPSGQQALRHRLHQLDEALSPFAILNNTELNKEDVFIKMAQKGAITKLLNAIQNGDIYSAEQAFERLKEAWPYQHKNGFLIPRDISRAENQLTQLLGGDIMQMTERYLVMRPDYIKAHGDRIFREVIATQKTYELMGTQGDIQNLVKAEQQLIAILETRRGRDDVKAKACLIKIQTILSAPLMQSYAVIAYGSLEQAKQEVRHIEQQVFNHFAKQGITDPFEVNAMIPESPYHEPLIVIHRIFEARPDFQEELQVDHVKHLYHTTDLTQAISENTDMLELYKAYDFGNGARLESRIEKLNQILEGNIVLSHETYVISDNATGLLTKEGLDPKLYLECTGNQLQQQIHQECVSIVEELALANQDVLVNKYCRSMLQFVDVAREYNKANSPIEAVKFVDVCWGIIDCCKAAGEGVIEGAIGTVINRPIDVAIFCVGGPQWLLAYNLGKIAYAYADIKIASLMSEEAGCQKVADYLQPLTDCIDAIHTGDITLRGSIKVAAAVATQVVIGGKVDAGLKEFLISTKEQAKKYLKKNPTATIAQYAVTPDGRLLRAAGGPGKNTMSFKDISGKGPKNAPTLKNTGGNAPRQIAEAVKITAKQASEAAKKLGFNKTNYYSSGQRVFQKGNRFITIDIDAHNGGFWKMADSVKNLAHKSTRMGTYDQLLNRIGN